MTKLIKNFDNFDDLQTAASSIGAVTKLVEFDPSNPWNSYEEFASDMINYISDNLPGWFNSDYPNCISASLNAYGISISKNGDGFGVRSTINRKTGDPDYQLSVTFGRDEIELKHNPTYVSLINSGFEVFDGKKIAKKKKS